MTTLSPTISEPDISALDIGALDIGDLHRGEPPRGNPGVSKSTIAVGIGLTLLLVLALIGLGGSQSGGGETAADPDGVGAAPAQGSLGFIQNQGQVDQRVSYYLPGSEASLFFTSSGVTFALAGPTEASTSSDPTALPGEGTSGEQWAVKLDFVGANTVQPTGTQQAEGVVNDLRGPAEEHRTNITTYSTITYHDLWPGIDLVYSGADATLKYDFVVHPGADPSQIRLAYSGATDVALNDDGQIEVITPAGGFADDKPYTYQNIDGQRVEVPSAYTLQPGTEAGSATFGIPVGDYDPTKELVIDPTVLLYAGFLGGSGSGGELATDVAVDDDGSAYVVGHTSSLDFPVTTGPSPSGSRQSFVVKVNAAGTELVYATVFDGGFRHIAVDDAGYAYLAGGGSSSDPTIPEDSPLTFAGGFFGAYVVKLNPAGTGLVYAAHIGGEGNESATGIALDDAGNAYIAGNTTSTEDTFPVTVGPDLTFNNVGSGNTDGFVAKVDAAGTSIVYAGYIGGESNDLINTIAVDDAGAAYVAGETSSREDTFPLTVGPDLTFAGVQPADRGESDAFVAKVDASGASLVYAGYIGGSDGDDLAVFTNTHGKDTANGIAVDSDGHAYVTGETMSTEATLPVTENGPGSTHNGFGDAYVAKVKPDGSGFAYLGYIGGSESDRGYGIAVDDDDNAYLTGYTESVNFPVLDGPSLVFSRGANRWLFYSDGFATKLTPGGDLVYSGYIGGSNWDHGNAIAVDGLGNAYIAGQSSSRHIGSGETRSFDTTYNGGRSDGFVVKVGESTKRK